MTVYTSLHMADGIWALVQLGRVFKYNKKERGGRKK